MKINEINFFNKNHKWHPFRWFFLLVICISCWLAYADYTGERILSFSNQQTWSASGPGQHK